MNDGIRWLVSLAVMCSTAASEVLGAASISVFDRNTPLLLEVGSDDAVGGVLELC